MADRTSAEIFGKVIRLLDEEKVDPTVIEQVWELSGKYDFSAYQADIDEILEKYNLVDEEAR